MRKRTLLLAAALVTGCGPLLEVPVADAPRPESELRVVTWNVHDLFDAEDRLLPPGTEDELPSPAAVEAKLDAVAAVLARLDADVVLLQEVENLALALELGARAGYAEARLVEGNDPRGIDVAVLSRPAIRRYVSHAAELDGEGRALWPRDCVEVHLTVGARRVAIVASHLSSRLSDDGTRRAAQAARMRAIADAISAADPEALVLVGGDLNDPPTAPGAGAARRGTAPTSIRCRAGRPRGRRAHAPNVSMPCSSSGRARRRSRASSSSVDRRGTRLGPSTRRARSPPALRFPAGGGRPIFEGWG